MNATNIPTDIRAPRVSGVYTAPERAERDDHGELKYETEPDASLLPKERADLRWRWNDCEAELGVRSTFGAQLDAALSQRISDEARKISDGIKLITARARRGRLPRRRARWVRAAEIQAHVDDLWERASRTRAPREAELAARGTLTVEDKPRELVAAEVWADDQQRALSGSEQRELDAWLTDQEMHKHTPMRPTPADPYENDGLLWLVRRLREVDRRLVAVGAYPSRVLESYYGPSSSGEDRLPMRKRFGDLGEIVVAIMASQRTPTDKPARAMVREKLSDDSFVRVMKHAASGYLRRAAETFASTRFVCACGVLASTRQCAGCGS